VSVLDFNKKNDLINVIDFYLLSKVHEAYNHLRKFITKMH
ncbi:hypothetical protein THOM_1441, partial [Trachipleistophora hominis]